MRMLSKIAKPTKKTSGGRTQLMFNVFLSVDENCQLNAMSDMDLSTKDSAERKNRKRDLRQNCEECKVKESIYQCPRCNIRTCSLECVKKHKVRTECNGKRNRGAFLPLCHMTDSSLRSDYFFLEEVLDRMPRGDSNKRAKTQHQLSRNFRRLLQQCEKRNIRLKMMPTMMERHKKNNSWYCVKRDVIMWKVEVIIVHSSTNKSSVSFQLSEEEADILTHVQKQAEKQNTTTVNDCMRLFVKKLPAPTNKQTYAEIDPIDSLKSLLAGMTIIEHPTIYCVDKNCIADFPTGNDKIKELPSGTTKGSGGVSDMKVDVSKDNSHPGDSEMNQEPTEKDETIVKSEDSGLMTEVSSKRRKLMVEDIPVKDDTVKQENGNSVMVDASAG